MCHKPFSQLVTACVAVVALSAVTAQAALINLDPNDPGQSVILADLLPGGAQEDGISVGDKTFSEFFYSTLPNDDMPDAGDINVFGFEDAAGNFGVSFHGAFLDLPGGGPSDALLRFTVEVSEEAAARGYRISDAHLFAGGLGLGDDSFISIDETFQENNESLSAFGTTLNGSNETQLSDWVFFDNLYTKLHVTKDILAIAGDTNVPARVTVIDQSFSQELIPEPTSIGLLSIALLGIAAGRRKS